MRLQLVLSVSFIVFILSPCFAKSVLDIENDINVRFKRNPIEEEDEGDDKIDDKSNESKDKSTPEVTDNTTTEEPNGGEESDEYDSPEEQTPDVPQEGVKLLIILVDGFRWDYVSRDKSLKGFRRIATNGVSAEYVKPIFPANSYPNWYSIVTGLYGESHGMIQNYMYDQTRDDVFAMAPHPNASHNHWWNQTEPLWVTAEKNGIKSAVYLWDGCQVRIGGIKPYVCHKYKALYDSDDANNETRVYIKNILDDFSNDKYRLALLYYEFVDHTGHAYGPRSRKTRKAIRDIDRMIDELYDSIEDRKLDNDVNVVIVSDHGMIGKEGSQVIRMKDILDFNDIELFLGEGSVSQILPEEGKEEEVYQELRQAEIKGLNVYKKDNIPEKFHFKNNKNVLPILLTTDKGYLIQAPRIKSKVYPDYERSEDNEPKGGGHGFDADYVDEMRAIMYGFGPSFRRNYVSEPLEMVDHYNLFCRLLSIPSHPNNGSEDRVEKLLKEYEVNDNSDESDYDDNEDNDNNEDNDDDSVSPLQLHSFLIYGVFVTIIISLF